VAKVLLVLAAIVDLALAALLIGVSGFIFGSGPESSHGSAALAAGYFTAVVVCIAAPIVGFVFTRRGKSGLGLALAWMPPVGALAAMLIPPPY
jgi:hypothetical protein